VILKRRASKQPGKDFLQFLLDELPNTDEGNKRVSHLLNIIVFAGLNNTFFGLQHSFFDIVTQKGLLDDFYRRSKDLKLTDINNPIDSNPWNFLKSSILESLRMAGMATGPSRICAAPVRLVTDPRVIIPQNDVLTCSAVLTHYDSKVFPQANSFTHERFLTADLAALPRGFLSFGFDPHTCPGRFYTVTTMQIVLRALFSNFNFTPDQYDIPPEKKYKYINAQASRIPVSLKIERRS